MVEVNDGRRSLRDAVVLRHVDELRRIERRSDHLVIGATVTYAELIREPVTSLMPALAQAARTVGSPQIRNAGTIGGNLATASPAGDTLPVLVALGAAVEVAGPSGRHTITVSELLAGPKRTALAPGELIVAVRVPVRRGPQEYLKVGVRNAMVIAVASLAFVVDLDTHTFGIGLGSVGPTALGAPDAAAWLAARATWADSAVTIDAADIAAFGPRVAAAARPIDDHRSTAAYRRTAVDVMARRAARRVSARSSA